MTLIIRCVVAAATVVLSTMVGPLTPCVADILYVDNLKGSDAFDGRSPRPTSETTGPTKTIGRALKLAYNGDTIIISNTGRPYYESITLSGRRNSGTAGFPFTIVGNGTVLDGSRPINPAAWRLVAPQIWKFTPWRKGYYQLILNGIPVKEYRPPNRPASLPKIPAGEWMAWNGSIYYSAAAQENPAEKPFRYAALSVGITLYDVHSLQIVDVTLRYFRLDGLNAHDRCRFATVENVRSQNNGRAGMAVGGSSAVLLRNCELTGNRAHSLLLFELGAAKIEDSKLSRPPTVPK